MRYTPHVLAAAILLHMKLQIPIRNGEIPYDLNAPVFPSCACSQGKVGFNRAGLCYCYAAQPKINHNTVWFCYGVSRKGQHRLAVARLVQSSNSKPWLTRPPSLSLSLSLPPSLFHHATLIHFSSNSLSTSTSNSPIYLIHSSFNGFRLFIHSSLSGSSYSHIPHFSFLSSIGFLTLPLVVDFCARSERLESSCIDRPLPRTSSEP